MPALNFLKRFAPLVESGTKRQTIRPRRKDCRNPQPGQTLYLYTGMRTQYCRKLKEAKCIASIPIVFEGRNVTVGIASLNPAQRQVLALADGFMSFDELLNFIEKHHELPFYGFLIKW
jgi:hypothetical protein